jgi:hypothetical protein
MRRSTRHLAEYRVMARLKCASILIKLTSAKQKRQRTTGRWRAHMSIIGTTGLSMYRVPVRSNKSLAARAPLTNTIKRPSTDTDVTSPVHSSTTRSTLVLFSLWKLEGGSLPYRIVYPIVCRSPTGSIAGCRRGCRVAAVHVDRVGMAGPGGVCV